MPRTTRSSNGNSEWVKLPAPSGNTINIDPAVLGGATVALQYSKDGTDANAKPLPNPANGNPYSTTAGDVIACDASGFVRMVITNYGNVPITLETDG